MKYLAQVIVITTFLLSLACAQEGFERVVEVSSGQQLSVDINSGGSIDILGWDEDKVEIRADIRRYDPEKYQIDVQKTSRGVELEAFDTFGRNRDVRFKIRVPQKFDLDLETMGGGIRIENVTGNIEGQTMGGELDFTKISGELHMTTMGGEIYMRDSRVNGEIKTMGGDMNFHDVSGKIKSTTMGGDVTMRSSLSRSESEIEGKVEVSTMGGDIFVEAAPQGAQVSTMGGDIDIRSAGKFVKAKTMGGDIEVREVNGGIRASTMGGDVIVKMSGDPSEGDRNVDLSSMGGDIELNLPADISARFRVKLTYTKNSSQDYRIDSDFPLKIEESSEWEYDNGSPRKYIYGTTKTGDGMFDVELETVNGDIIIRKH